MTPTLIIYAKKELSCKELLPAQNRPWWELPFWWTHLLICPYNQFSNRGVVPFVSEMISRNSRIFTTLIYSHRWVILGTPRWCRTHLATQETQKTQFDPWVRKIPRRRKWQPTPVFLPEKNPMDRVAGCSPRGHKESYFYTSLWNVYGFLEHHTEKKKIYASQNSVTVWLSWARDQLESYSQPSFLSSYPGVPTKTLSLTQEGKRKREVKMKNVWND